MFKKEDTQKAIPAPSSYLFLITFLLIIFICGFVCENYFECVLLLLLLLFFNIIIQKGPVTTASNDSAVEIGQFLQN